MTYRGMGASFMTADRRGVACERARSIARAGSAAGPGPSLEHNGIGVAREGSAISHQWCPSGNATPPVIIACDRSLATYLPSTNSRSVGAGIRRPPKRFAPMSVLVALGPGRLKE